MCDYCDKGKNIIDYQGMRVTIDDANLWAEWCVEDELYGDYDTINYCPMCGRDLRGQS